MPPVKINWQIAELSSCLLFVVVGIGVGSVCALSVPSPRQEAGRCLITEGEGTRERGKEGDRETETKRWRGRLGGETERERDREGVKACGDTSRCQTHRHTAATDSSLQPRLEAQLDTGNERT